MQGAKARQEGNSLAEDMKVTEKKSPMDPAIPRACERIEVDG